MASEDEQRITIYAELSKKQLGMIERDEVSIEIPYGTSMGNKPIGKRGLMFFCEGQKAAKDLVMGLDNSAINWQIQEGSLDERA